MKEWASRLRGEIGHHRVWPSIIVLVLLAGMGVGLVWTVNLVRFGLPPPAGQNCGSLDHRYRHWKQTDRADAYIQTMTCFWSAYQACQAATISQADMGVDAGYTMLLTVERRGNRCAIYGYEEDVAGPNHTNRTFLCTSLSKAGDALQVSNCDGDKPFTLEPRYVSESYSCGVIGGAYPQDTPQRIESCFFTAYNQCLADSMGYDTLEAGAEVQREFYIDNHCGIAYQRGSYAAACTSLELRADGLHVAQCGDDGDIFIPLATQL